jgi:uncharacterized membrane protein YagU involved in acid resistance
MSTTTIPLSAQGSKAARVIFWAGLIAGVLDLTGACLVAWLRAGVTPVRVFHSIASGIYGSAAFTGGAKMAVLGVVLHFIIATTWAAVYYFASRQIRFLINQPIISGVLYGVVVYLFMNFVVLPLSAVARRPAPLSARIIGMLVIIFCVGLPIAFVVRRFSNKH